MVTVEDYEAFYRMWLPIELARGLGGVEEARKRAHFSALEECREMPKRHGGAEVGLEEINLALSPTPAAPTQSGTPPAPPQAGTPPAPPQAGGKNGARKRGA